MPSTGVLHAGAKEEFLGAHCQVRVKPLGQVVFPAAPSRWRRRPRKNENSWGPLAFVPRERPEQRSCANQSPAPVRALTGEAHTQWTCPGEEGPGSPRVTWSDAPKWLPHCRDPGFGVVMRGQAVHGGIHEEPRDGVSPLPEFNLALTQSSSLLAPGTQPRCGGMKGPRKVTLGGRPGLRSREVNYPKDAASLQSSAWEQPKGRKGSGRHSGHRRAWKGSRRTLDTWSECLDRNKTSTNPDIGSPSVITLAK